MKYIDADRLREELQKPKNELKVGNYYLDNSEQAVGYENALVDFELLIDALQQERQMPDSTQLIAEWEKEKAVLEQKDFRGDAERMAYNAFLDGFVKGLGYEGTR